MSNTTAIQIIEDGPRNCVVKMTGILDTSDLSRTDLLDPAAQVSVEYGGVVTHNTSTFAIRRIDWSCSTGDVPDIRLWWDANSDVLIETLNGRGSIDFKEYPLWNNAGAGKTGKVQIDTKGYSSGVIEFTVTVWAIKVS